MTTDDLRQPLTNYTFPVYGKPIDEKALEQIKNIAIDAEAVALMADHHMGYSMPIGGVAAYKNAVSPTGVGFDIACGNKAVRVGVRPEYVLANIGAIMDRVFSEVSFGVGRSNQEPVDHALFDDDPAWDIPAVAELKDLAYRQLGTVGSGNHFVDIFLDEYDEVWVGVHFGSRGLGHKITTHFMREAGAHDNQERALLFDLDSDLGEQYFVAMNLAGRYAYAGRDWVCDKVASILGGEIVESVHNHHNFAWKETHEGIGEVIVVRKGATPAFPGQRGFVGGSMGDNSVIIEGTGPDVGIMRSTVHGAGRVMSRTQAAGKRRWKKGKLVKNTEGEVKPEMLRDWIDDHGRKSVGQPVELRGGGLDESPHCYKRLHEVIEQHSDTINVLHVLRPVGVAMAGANEFDPYKD